MAACKADSGNRGAPDGGRDGALDGGAAGDRDGGPDHVTDGGSDAGRDASPDAGVEAVRRMLSFSPSNVTLEGLDLSEAGDVVITGPNNYVNSESGYLAGSHQAVYQEVTITPSRHLGLFVVRSLRVEPGSSLTVDGVYPVVIVALDSITIAGGLASLPGTGGGAWQLNRDTTGGGPGGGPAGTASGTIYAGSGGSFCGIGGAGAAQGGGAPNTRSAPYGVPELVPLLAGSSGGTGVLGSDGKSGGALQLVAGTSISVLASGFVSVPGGGGAAGGSPARNEEAGGAGSGGALLLEAPAVTVAGVLAANGGGGGQGAGDMGATGQPSAVPAPGGIGGLGHSPGGAGNASDDPDGKGGMASGGAPAGGGGGGAGRIRINTRSGPATITGTLSPAASTSCVSFGALP